MIFESDTITHSLKPVSLLSDIIVPPLRGYSQGRIKVSTVAKPGGASL